MSDPLLQALADAADIEAHYWDIQGRIRERTPETARNILWALGLAAQTDSQVRESLAFLSSYPWRQVVPPVAIAQSGSAIEVPLRLSADCGGQWIEWILKCEDGTEIIGQKKLSDLSIQQTGMIEGVALNQYRFELSPQLPGYHQLQINAQQQEKTNLIVAPPHCYFPQEFDRQRHWAIAAQLYAVRSEHNWGMGDFGDLRSLMNWVGQRNAKFVGLNPLHALFLDEPGKISPYCPASRLFLNPLYLEVTAVADFQESNRIQSLAAQQFSQLQAERHASLIDYPKVTSAKLAIFRELFEHFYACHFRPQDIRGRELQAYVEKAGTDLTKFAAYQHLSAEFNTNSWQHWPVNYQDSSSQAVDCVLNQDAKQILFFQYLQWQCEQQLTSLARNSAVGLYRDLAIGVDTASADHWSKPESFLRGLTIGAPPDPFNESGQNWGLIPENPRKLKSSGYAHFIAILRANMASTRALRIDHIMGWQRLFVIPGGASACDGAYLRFPIDDLLSIAALESWRHNCILIGEDLGTVPEGFREHMASKKILSTRILYFEKDSDAFRKPKHFPKLALASVSTHDLATLRGFWTEEDIAAKSQIGLYRSAADEHSQRLERKHDKMLLLRALKEENLLPEDVDPQQVLSADWTIDIAIAVHNYLAMSDCALVAIQLDDLAEEAQQINLPGTLGEYPNWRRRLHRSLQDLASDKILKEALDLLTRTRERV